VYALTECASNGRCFRTSWFTKKKNTNQFQTSWTRHLPNLLDIKASKFINNIYIWLFYNENQFNITVVGDSETPSKLLFSLHLFTETFTQFIKLILYLAIIYVRKRMGFEIYLLVNINVINEIKRLLKTQSLECNANAYHYIIND